MVACGNNLAANLYFRGVYVYERIFLEQQLHALVAKIQAVKVDEIGAVIVQEGSHLISKHQVGQSIRSNLKEDESFA